MIVKYRFIWFLISLVIIIPGLISIFTNGFKRGIDFAGGSLLELRLEQPADAEGEDLPFVREAMELYGIEGSAQEFGEGNYLIRTDPLSNESKNNFYARLRDYFEVVEENRFESIDPTIGAETVRRAILAVVLATMAVLLYIAYAFRRLPKPATAWKFSLATVIALIHDILIILGAFSLLGAYYGVEVNALFVTAVLTLVGYSVHDTIVTFDRIRENLKQDAGSTFTEIADKSVLETITRSLNTSFTLVFVILALLVFGGATLYSFMLALLIGVVAGTYSSIFIATPVLVMLQGKD